MSVLSVEENFTGLTAGDEIGSDGRKIGAGTRFYDVVFDENDIPALRPFLAKAHLAIPQLGEPHPFDAWIYVLSRRVTVTDKSPFVYRVTVQYKEILNPIDEPPIIEWVSVSTNEVVTFDVDGKAIANSSDEPVDPPHTEKFTDVVLRATWNVVSFDPIAATDYEDAINSDIFLGFDPGLAKVMENTGREIRAITGNFYVARTVEIQFRKDGWKRQFVDEGFRIKDGTNEDDSTKYTAIDDAVNSGEPVKLNGEGQRLADGDDDVLIEYETKKPLPFNTEFSRIA